MSPRLFLLCVGIDDYEASGLRSLKYAKNDAVAVYEVLSSAVDPPYARTSLLLNDQASCSAIRAEMGERVASEAEPEDTVIFYYAGHGASELSLAAGSAHPVDRFLVPNGTDPDHLYSEAFSLSRDLPDILRRIVAKNTIVVLDCCFSGGAEGRGFEGPRYRRHRLTTGTNPASKLVGQTGDLVEVGEGSVVLAACGPDQVALEEANLGHGVFTYYLLDILRGDDDSSTVSVALAHHKLTRSVSAHTRGTQIPVLISGRGGTQNQSFLVRG